MIGCFRDDEDDDDEHFPHPDGKIFSQKIISFFYSKTPKCNSTQRRTIPPDEKSTSSNFAPISINHK